MDEQRDLGNHIEKSVELYPCFRLSKFGLPKYAQAYMDCRRVKGIDLAFNHKVIGGTFSPGYLNKLISKLLKDLTVAFLVCLGKITSGNRFA